VRMVNVTKGILVECDPAMKQFLLHLDEKLLLGSRFIIQDLDDTHIFISVDVLDQLQDKIDDLMDKVAVPVVEGREALNTK
jgi:TFIIH basal transcription factor complex TTD-A subunit